VDERAIIQGCRAGNRDAQRALYELFADRIYSLLRRITRDEHAAFDLAQDTFMRAFERIGEFEGRSGLGTWLYRIATNQALQWLRKRRTERRHEERIARDRRSGNHEDEPAYDLENGLLRLSEQHRLILLLRYHEELSYDEIAGILEVSPGTVASRLNRAREELRKILLEQRGACAEEKPDAARPK